MHMRYILMTCILASTSLALLACQHRTASLPYMTKASYISSPDFSKSETGFLSSPSLERQNPLQTSSSFYTPQRNSSYKGVNNAGIVPVIKGKEDSIHPQGENNYYSSRQTRSAELTPQDIRTSPQKQLPCTQSKVPPMLQGQTSTDMVNIETPMRCRVPEPPSRIISDIPLTQGDFELTRVEENDALPRYEVNGYTFDSQPLDMAIQVLVSEADINVYSDDGLFPDMSAQDIRGELSAVIEELTDSADAYAHYDASKKRLYLSHWARFRLKVPGGYIGMYAVLDALRGANITNVQPDWGQNELYFRVTKSQEAIIRRLISYLKEDPRLLMLDINVYKVYPKGGANISWRNVIQSFGDYKVNMSINGLQGRMIITDHQEEQNSFLNNLKAYAQVDLVSKGVAVMPNGWKVRFDIGQCSFTNTPEKDLSLLLQSKIQSTDRIESNIALDTVNGEVTSFYSFYSIDDDLNIVGIPGTVFNQSTVIEYFITMKPRIMRLIK